MNKCPSCGRLKIGELQSLCKYCGFSSGSDRWYAADDDHRLAKTRILLLKSAPICG